MIFSVAEMTDDLAVRILIPELFQLLATQAQQHLFGALGTAVTLVLHLALIQNIGVEACQCKVHHILGGLAFPKQFSNGRHGGDVLLQLGDLGIGGTGQQLQQEAARAGNGQVSIHQHPQSADGGHLLAVSIVAGQVLGDLAGDQRHLAHSGFFLQAVGKALASGASLEFTEDGKLKLSVLSVNYSFDSDTTIKLSGGILPQTFEKVPVTVSESAARIKAGNYTVVLKRA